MSFWYEKLGRFFTRSSAGAECENEIKLEEINKIKINVCL